jgi:hypothetical protein
MSSEDEAAFGFEFKRHAMKGARADKARRIPAVYRRTHRLKTWPEFFRAIQSGERTFEVRRDDRRFAVGDDLVLAEYDPAPGYDPATGEFSDKPAGFTGRHVLCRITHKFTEGGFGIQDGYCVLGLGEP